jgi:integrase
MTTGISIRHSRECATEKVGKDAACTCKPSYEPRCTTGGQRGRSAGRFATSRRQRAGRHDAASALRKGTMRAPTKLTLRQAAEEWLEGAKAGTIRKRGGERYKPAVLRGYEADLYRYVLPELGARRLSEIQRGDVQAFADRLLEQGRSPSKVLNVLMPLRAIYRRPIARGEIAINPTTQLELPTPEGCRDRVASPGEAAELLEALPEQDRALWACAFFAGLRRGELRGLRWEDIDFDAGVIHVERGWDEKEGPIEPKSRKGTRAVPIASVLRAHLAQHKLRSGRSSNNVVFGSRPDHPFTPTNIRKRALRAWNQANAKRREDGLPELEPIGLHECRHTYVTLMHAAGDSLETIGDYVGHSSAYMTDRYRHLIKGQRAESAKRLDALLEAANRA